MTPYKQITVVSGKGGTGKTSVVASFAALGPDKVLADTDVDAANLHLMLHPKVNRQEQFYGAQVAVRDENLCTRCGECERHCRFEAITVEAVNPFACEGCGFCTLVCPRKALHMEPALTGDLFVSQTRYGPMAHAKLVPGAESSGRLVTMVRQAAEDLAMQDGRNLVLIDGPPGIGCTATAALADVDLALIVTEPTPSGIHDMRRVIGTAAHFCIPTALIVNKADLNLQQAQEAEGAAREMGASIIGRLPYDETVTRAVAAATPLVEFDPDGPVSQALRNCWSRTLELIGMQV